MKLILYILLILCCFTSCTNNSGKKIQVVATTGWTAAYALAAGADEVSVLAPYEMVHPSEYELRPGDIDRLKQARIIVFAGYEVIVNQLKTGLKIPEEKLLMITTSYNVAEMEESIMMIAKKLGTEETAINNIKEIKELFAKGRTDLQQKGMNMHPALVHFFQESFSMEAGIMPLDIFGPAPPEPRQILKLTNSGAKLIIDNAHNPVGGSVRETLPEAKYLMLLNFPGMHNTRTLAEVIEYNFEQLNS